MYIIRGTGGKKPPSRWEVAVSPEKGIKIKEPESGEKKCRVSFDFGGWGASWAAFVDGKGSRLHLFPFVI